MALKIKVFNIKQEFENLLNSKNKLSKQESKKVVEVLVEELRQKTPIDTGLARDSWKVEDSLFGIDIKNTTDYIQYLNQGSSKQAPAYFIESVALKYGDPIGKIVDVE
jgi:hypothetical protein